MKRRLSALVLAILVTCTSWSAIAGDKEEAKQLFDAGLKLMHLDDFAGATANFERSVALYPTQNSLFNLANCYKAMQRYGDALAVIGRLKRDFADKLKPEIREAVERQQQEIQSLVAKLTLVTVPADATIRIDGKDAGKGPTLGPLLLGPGEHEIEAARTGHRSLRRSVKLVSGAARTEKFVLELEAGAVLVHANLEGASVFVDGRQVGTTPLTEAISLPAGKHRLSVRAPDHEDAERDLAVQAGSKEVITIVLTAKTTKDLVAPRTEPASPTSEASLSAAGSRPAKSRTLRVVTWTSAAGAVAAGAVAGAFWLISRSQNQDFQRANDGTNRDKASDLANDVRRSTRIAIGCGIGAGALAITALVTYLLDSEGEERKSTVSLSPFGMGVRF